MKSRRNTVAVAIIALIVGLFATTWSVMADYDPVPVLVPSGVYTTDMGTPGGTYIITMTIIPMDPAGNKMIIMVPNDNSDPTYFSTEPPTGEADHLTDYVGNMVRTGPDTWAYTGVAYGTKKVEGQLLPEVLYMELRQGTMTGTEDGNTLTLENNTAFYLPEQDVDGDGFPDADQEPIYCSPVGLLPVTRIPVIPPCGSEG